MAIAVPIISYRCPDCGQVVETYAAEHWSDGRDTYERVLCPKCQQLHSVNPASRQVMGEDELGHPW
jgi:acetone carboxylase gamma subunit